MSKLLLDEYPLLILPQLARAIGLNEAIVLQQIHYWLELYKQGKSLSHCKDGRWWVWNSVRNWQINFPFWSSSTIGRILQALREPYPPEGEERKEGDPRVQRGPLLIATQKYNRAKYDQTLWYTICYNEIQRIEKTLSQNGTPLSQNGTPLSQNGTPLSHFDEMHSVKMTKPIPETTTETTPEITAVAAPVQVELFPTDNGDFAQALRAYQNSFGPLGSSFKYEKFQMLWDEYPNPEVHKYAREEMYEAMMDDKRRVHPNLNYYAQCLATGKARASPPKKQSFDEPYNMPDMSDPDIQEWLAKKRAGTLPYHED